jgi:uncharacterized protein YifE (UPF0438 family)
MSVSIPSGHRRYLRQKTDIPKDSILDADQKILIEKYGAWLYALMSHYIDAVTEEQAKFLLMCDGKRKPESSIEIAWYLFRIDDMYRHKSGLRETKIGTEYKETRKFYKRLAMMGHPKARAWLEKEGPWRDEPSAKQSNYAERSIFNQPYPLHNMKQVSGSFGAKTQKRID